jgi:YVTN family beta-propeller protein
MKRLKLLFSFLLLSTFIFYSCNEGTNAPVENSEVIEQDFAKHGWGRGSGNIVIANRGSGSISVIDAKTDEVTGTYSLPSGPNTPEPMYVVFVRPGQRVVVGDRANDQVVVFRASDFSIETTIPVGKGVFHMWADNLGRQLWVNNDIDNTTSVINLHSLQVIATVPTPADLVSLGGKPHDVILGPAGKFAYITLVGIAGESDYVVQFSTRTFDEKRRIAVGKDPHLSLTPGNPFLYVPCQNTNEVYVLGRLTLNLYKTISVPGAHGAAMTTNGKVFYTTNLPGGGPDGLFAINAKRNYVIGAGDTPYPVPHNIAITPNSKKLYVTHSGGTSDKVTIYKISNRNPIPTYVGEVTVGLNPFGLDYAK